MLYSIFEKCTLAGHLVLSELRTDWNINCDTLFTFSVLLGQPEADRYDACAGEPHCHIVDPVLGAANWKNSSKARNQTVLRLHIIKPKERKILRVDRNAQKNGERFSRVQGMHTVYLS